MAEFFRGEQFNTSEEQEEQKGKSGKKKAGKILTAAAIIGSQAVNLLGKDVFEASKARAEAEKAPEAPAAHVIVSGSEEKPFVEFVKQGTEPKISEEHLQLLETASGDTNFDGKESRQGASNIYAGYSENGMRVSSENRASGLELVMKREADKMLSYIKDAEQAKGNNLLAISVDISRSQRPSDYRREESRDWGTVQDLINEKNPRAGAIVSIVAGVLNSQYGTLGRVGYETDKILFSQIRESRILRANFRTDYYNLKVETTRGEKKGGKPDFSGGNTDAYLISFAVETAEVTVQAQGLNGQSQEQTVTSYSLVGADTLVNQGLVAQDSGRQQHAFFIDDGLMPKEEVEALKDGVITVAGTQGVNDPKKITDFLVLAAELDTLRRNSGKTGDTQIAKRIALNAQIQQQEIVRQQQEKEAQKQAKKNKKH